MLRGILLSLFAGWFSALPSLAPGSEGTRADSRKTKTVTVTGCLTEGPQPNTFLLARVPDPLVDPLVIGVSGSVPTVTYQLTSGKDLRVHLGHRVEITGKAPVTPEAALKVKEAEAREEKPSGQPATKVEIKEELAIAVRPLTVEAVRVVAPTCLEKEP
jgi:hypothetical protein